MKTNKIFTKIQKNTIFNRIFSKTNLVLIVVMIMIYFTVIVIGNMI